MTFNRSELERLYQQIETPLFNVVLRWVWNRDDAADVVQESFVRLWAMRDEVRVDAAQALVYRIALNLAAKRRRNKRLWQWVSLDAVFERASSSATSERLLLTAETDAQVKKAIEALPEGLKRVVTLCELTDLGYDEVARILEIPVGTVGSRRNAAFKKLQQSLGSFQEDAHET